MARVARAGAVGVLALSTALAVPAGPWSSLGAQESGVAWSGSLAPGDVLEVRGVLGGITARPSTASTGEVRFEKTARRSDVDEVRLEVVEHAGGVTVCAVYPGARGECRLDHPASRGDHPTARGGAPPGGDQNLRGNDVQVEFHVSVPRGVRFRAVTVNGDVEALELDGDVEAHTVNGDVEIGTSGWAEAETVNGSIRASLGAPRWDRELDFSTVNGGITLELRPDVDAEVEARWVNGGLESDLPLTVQGRFTSRRARGVLGEGGHRLTLSTVNGPIRIRAR